MSTSAPSPARRRRRIFAGLSPLVLSPLVAVAALVACDRAPPETPAGSYHGSMVALVEQNARLSRELQGLAADIKKDAPPAEDVATRLEKKVLPELRDLATQVEGISPGSPELAAAHPLIVDAWKDRAAGVEATLNAWRKADPVAAEAALNDRYSAARQEAAYFERINLVLVPEGYVLTPFSTATTAPTAAAD